MPACPAPESSGTREALLEAALCCFAEHGFEGASLRMIAERAGKNTSLIAHHFGNKEALYLAVFRDMLEDLRAHRYSGPLIGPEELRGDPARAEALLRSLVVWLFKSMRMKADSGDPRQTAYSRLWFSAVRAPVPELEALLREHIAPLRMQIAACIQALRPDLPVREIPFWCSLVYGQCLVNTSLHTFNQLVFGPECYPKSMDRMADLIADITLRAIGRPETPRPSRERA